MITRVQAYRYRSLQNVDQSLTNFDILVGPNGSGKTTFLDVIAFLGEMVSSGLDEAIGERTANYQDLFWRRQGQHFELAIEAQIPEELQEVLPASSNGLDSVRYQVQLGFDPVFDVLSILYESLGLKNAYSRVEFVPYSRLFESGEHPNTMMEQIMTYNRPIIAHTASNHDADFIAEVSEDWFDKDNDRYRFRLSPVKSALANLPEDETKFPIAVWFKRLLMESVQKIFLNSSMLRTASRSGMGHQFRADGSNLPWLVENLKKSSKSNFTSWLKHLKTVLPELDDIRTVNRPEDNHRYLMLMYKHKVEIPSWMVSDGTLRLLALTILGYLPSLTGTYFLEEPEDGIHPRAIEAVYQSLSSAYDAQILLATHSPILLNLADLQSLLCFSKNDEGATEIIRGDKHPLLRDWRHETSLGSLLAAGVLG